MSKNKATKKKSANMTATIQLVNSHEGTKDSTLIVFSFAANKSENKKDEKSQAKISNSELAKILADSIEDKTITGKAQEAVVFRALNFNGHKNVVVVGLGTDYDHETVRQAAAGAYEAVKSTHSSLACLEFDSIGGGKKDLPRFLGAFTEGWQLRSYHFDELKSKKKDENKKELQLFIVSKLYSDATAKKELHDSILLSECVNFSRRLGDLPGNLMNPTILADSVVKAAAGTGIKSEVWGKERIQKEKMGGLLGVAQGSDQEPRFIILRYNGAEKSKKPLVFVGKGLTFDSGGISLKPGAAMEEMKYDMCGGANVLGAMLAIAKLKLNVNAIGLVPSTENMPNGSATKPGDVHTARNGKTFEVNNTDAEGRLILSDALCYGSEQKPELIVDAATLTGAMVVALGNTHTGYFTKNEALSKKIQQAADDSGEWVWRMPLCEFHTKDMKGTYADLSNISSGKGAGSSTAAAFLEQFVEEGIPWAHFDIAGTGWAVGGRLPYCTKKGASGVLVRTFVELAKLYQK
jgi:leucyl aminopeptidase